MFMFIHKVDETWETGKNSKCVFVYVYFEGLKTFAKFCSLTKKISIIFLCISSG